MHYYKLNIPDWNLSTSHLTLEEEAIYFRLVNHYYDTEQPFSDLEMVFRRLRMVKQSAQAMLILREFFIEQDGEWHHLRCDKEIEEYKKAKANHWGNKLTPAQRRLSTANRNAKKALATPEWTTVQMLDEIAKKYTEAASLTATTGIKYEVDHIVPLRGKTVSGLHVPWNLRVITAFENRIKSNQLLEH